MRNILNSRLLIILIYLLCTACGSAALPSIKPFKLDVQQGNVVTSKMLLQLRPGMTKSQVRFIMGSPLIQDSFHGNRWDYAYQLRENGKLKEQRRVILDFENDVLKTVRGDVVPAGSDAAKALQSEADAAAAGVKKEADKSLVDKLKFWDKSDAAQTVESAPKNLKNGITNSPVAAPVALLPNGDKSSDAAREDHTVATPEQPAALSETAKADATVPPEVVVIDEPSMMAVPLAAESAPVAEPAVESVPANKVPDAEIVQMDTPAPAVEPEPMVVIKAEPKTTEPAPAVAEPVTVTEPAIEPPAVALPVAASRATNVEDAVTLEPQEDAPAMPSGYQSESGMLFDRALKLTPIDPALVSTVPSSSEKSTSTATPKALPDESEPGFFDRMLEKVGF